MSARKKATVKWFDSKKGYGFLEPEDGGNDVFVHITDVNDAGLSTLQEGQKLYFDVAVSRGRTKAVSLERAA